MGVSVLATVWAKTREEVAVLRIWRSFFPVIFYFILIFRVCLGFQEPQETEDQWESQ